MEIHLIQKLKQWILVGSPFLFFYLLGILFQSSYNYVIKASCVALMVLFINISGRFCRIMPESTMEFLPVAIYLATKVLIHYNKWQFYSLINSKGRILFGSGGF